MLPYAPTLEYVDNHANWHDYFPVDSRHILILFVLGISGWSPLVCQHPVRDSTTVVFAFGVELFFLVCSRVMSFCFSRPLEIKFKKINLILYRNEIRRIISSSIMTHPGIV